MIKGHCCVVNTGIRSNREFKTGQSTEQSTDNEQDNGHLILIFKVGGIKTTHYSFFKCVGGDEKLQIESTIKGIDQ